MPRSIRSATLWFALALAGAAATARGADAPAAPPPGPAKPAADPLSPPEIVKPVIPNKAEMADSAFKKLDPTGKGYVTMEDTKGLEGFDQAFRAADPDRTGKLDLPRFKQAWSRYSGYRQ